MFVRFLVLTLSFLMFFGGQPARAGDSGAMPASTCAFHDLHLPPDVVVYAAGAYKGRPLGKIIDDHNKNEATRMDVTVRSARPVALILSAYDPTIWNIQWAEGTTIAAVIVSGYEKQVPMMPEPDIPLIVDSYADQHICDFHYLRMDDSAALGDVSQKLFGRAVDRIYKAENGAVTIGTGVADSAPLHTPDPKTVAAYIDAAQPHPGAVERARRMAADKAEMEARMAEDRARMEEERRQQEEEQARREEEYRTQMEARMAQDRARMEESRQRQEEEQRVRMAERQEQTRGYRLIREADRHSLYFYFAHYLVPRFIRLAPIVIPIFFLLGLVSFFRRKRNNPSASPSFMDKIRPSRSELVLDIFLMTPWIYFLGLLLLWFAAFLLRACASLEICGSGAYGSSSEISDWVLDASWLIIFVFPIGVVTSTVLLIRYVGRVSAAYNMSIPWWKYVEKVSMIILVVMLIGISGWFMGPLFALVFFIILSAVKEFFLPFMYETIGIIGPLLLGFPAFVVVAAPVVMLLVYFVRKFRKSGFRKPPSKT